MISIGNNIRIIRKSLGYSQEYVALRLKMTQQHYRRLENENEDSLSWGRIKTIADVLGVSIEDLLIIGKTPIFNQNPKDCSHFGNVNPTFNNDDQQKHILDLKEQIQKKEEVYERYIADMKAVNESQALLIQKLLEVLQR
jgi:transcriptional regulator with XRE-family HTH domain